MFLRLTDLEEVWLGEGGVASGPVSHGEIGMASVYFSEGGVASVVISKRGVACVSSSERGVALVSVSHTEAGGVASVCHDAILIRTKIALY